MQPIKQVIHNEIEYHIFREEEEGLLCVKFDLGHQSAATGHPMLTLLGRGGINAEGTFAGILTMKDKDGRYLHPKTRGSFVLRLLIDLDIEAGKVFNQFKSTWVAGHGVSDNLDMLNNGLARGLSEEAAALQTWTGQWLLKHYGFDAVKDIHGKWHLEQNSSGKDYKHYTEVSAVFYKAPK